MDEPKPDRKAGNEPASRLAVTDLSVLYLINYLRSNTLNHLSNYGTKTRSEGESRTRKTCLLRAVCMPIPSLRKICRLTWSRTKNLLGYPRTLPLSYKPTTSQIADLHGVEP